MISSNGARVTDIRERKTLFTGNDTKRTTLSLLERCKVQRLVTASHMNNRYLLQGRMAAAAGRFIYGEDAKGIYCVRDMARTVKKSAFQTEELQFYFLTKQSRQRLKVFWNFIRSCPRLTRPYMWRFSRRMPIERQGAEALAGHLGITREETACIGDGENDLSMFEASGFNIAMGNAFDGLKKKADYVTASNNREGAAKAV